MATLLLVPSSTSAATDPWRLLVYALFPVDPVVELPSAQGYLGTLS